MSQRPKRDAIMTKRPFLQSFQQHTMSGILLLILSVTFIAPLPAQTPSFGTFDAPNAGNNQGEGTRPITMNQNGAIAGIYIDRN